MLRTQPNSDSPLTLQIIFLIALLGLLPTWACSETIEADSSDGDALAGDGGKEDSGWLASDSYEVGGLVRSSVQQEAVLSWADLASDATLQATLVDTQLKFIKTAAEANGWRFNQLADAVEITEITVDGNTVTLEFEAVIDMLGRLNGDLPTLEQLETSFSAQVPLNPTSFRYTDYSDCAESDDSHSVSGYNFHYYFAPEAEDCGMSLVTAEVEVTEVFERVVAYPEYDRLMQDLGEGRVGFSAALVPNTGDSDRMSRFNAHARMLENELELAGVDAEDGTYRRYVWARGPVRMTIDLYDPTAIPWGTGFEASFRERLGEYTLIHYNGHSSYGTKHLLDDPESFSDAYQIIMMHSCQSYAYYTRQIFRAKETEADPTGFDLADIVATGKSSYPSGSPITVRILLNSLMNGMAAVYDEEPENAPDWLSITNSMRIATWGDIMYGVAGVRTNLWQPPSE